MAPVCGPGITTAMLAVSVVLDEYLSGRFDLAVRTAKIGAFGFFTIVVQSTLEFDQQSIIQMKTNFAQGFLDNGQRDLVQIVMHL